MAGVDRWRSRSSDGGRSIAFEVVLVIAIQAVAMIFESFTPMGYYGSELECVVSVRARIRVVLVDDGGGERFPALAASELR